MKLHRKKKKKGRDMKKCCRLVAIFHTNNIESCADQFSSVAQLPPTVCDPMDARQASKSITNSWSLLKLMSIKSVMPSNHLILFCPLLHLPSVFPSIRVFSNKSVLRIRWAKYSTLSDNPWTGFSKERVGHEELLPPCGCVR